MYSEKIERLIKGALADGKLTDGEKRVLINAAKAEGVDPDELVMEVEAQLLEQNPEPAPLPKQQVKGNVVIPAPEKNPAVAELLAKMNPVIKAYMDNRWREYKDRPENNKGGVPKENDQRAKENLHPMLNIIIQDFDIPNDEAELAGFTLFLYRRLTSDQPSEFKTKFIESKRKMEKLYGDRPSFHQVDKKTRLTFWQSITENQKGVLVLEIIALIGIIIYVIVALNK